MKDLIKEANEYINAYKQGLIDLFELIEMVEYLEQHVLFEWNDVWESIHYLIKLFESIEFNDSDEEVEYYANQSVTK